MSDKQHQEIDPAGQEVVLEYVGPGHVGDVPARDLDGGDVARIAWVRAHRAVEWEREGAADPPQPTPKQVGKLAADLVETGVYIHATKTTKPATPAETPEA
jgi:hypothetical protein